MNSSPQVKAPEKSRSKVGVFVVATFLVIAAAGGIGFRYHQKSRAAQGEVQEIATLELVHLETFVVNLTDDQHTYLRIGIDLGVTKGNEKEEKTKSADVSVVRDSILALLSSANSAQISSPEGKQKLKADLLVALNTRLPQLGVREIYITEFLIQR